MKSVHLLRRSEYIVLILAAGRWWGPQDVQPVIALHGWQDNASTFDPLMELLPPSLSVLAIDLPGHGMSSHYPPGSLYHFTEDIVHLRYIVKHFKWQDISLMGHSMGGSYSFLYAAIFPTQVQKLVTFDIIRPFRLNTKSFVQKGGDQIDKCINYFNASESNAPAYIMDELIARQYEATRGSVIEKSSKILFTRNCVPSKEKKGYYRLRRDIRLKQLMFFTGFPHEFLLEMASRIRCHVLNIKAKPGMYFEEPNYYEDTLQVLRQSAKSVQYHEVPGTHHAHLNNPEYSADIVGKFLLDNN